MTGIAKIGPKNRLQAFLTVSQITSLLLLVTLFSAVPSHAYSWYSGASVGSDGTIYGFGVTDVTYPGMYHTAYANVTLTSPVKHRVNYINGSHMSSITQNIELTFDPNDLGVYVVTTIHSGYCHTCDCYILNNVGSRASATARMTKYAALIYDNTQTDICGYKMRYRNYEGLDDYGWIPNNEYWTLNESFTSKDPSCGPVVIDGSSSIVGFEDTIDIGCANPTTCVYQTNQTFSVAPVQGQVMTQVPGKDCVGITDAATCRAQPSHTGWHVSATATSITVTDN